MRVAMDAVREAGKVCEGTVCYTGDILNPDRAKYDLNYYVRMGKDLRSAGAHVLGLKDMAGLLKPAAARVLIKALQISHGEQRLGALTVSAGVAQADEHTSHPSELLRAADEALYAAKNAGRDRVIVYQAKESVRSG